MSVFVLMGVAGSGKTTVGRRVADALNLTFIEGDDFHPESNIRKMSSGVALTDADRAPWIAALADGINHRVAPQDAIVAASALSRTVRKQLRESVKEPLQFLLLSANRAIIEARLATRPRHYMKPGMLDSQLTAFEAPASAIILDADRPLEQVCEDVVRCIRSGG